MKKGGEDESIYYAEKAHKSVFINRPFLVPKGIYIPFVHPSVVVIKGLHYRAEKEAKKGRTFSDMQLKASSHCRKLDLSLLLDFSAAFVAR